MLGFFYLGWGRSSRPFHVFPYVPASGLVHSMHSSGTFPPGALLPHTQNLADSAGGGKSCSSLKEEEVKEEEMERRGRGGGGEGGAAASGGREGWREAGGGGGGSGGGGAASMLDTNVCQFPPQSSR